MGHSFFVFLHQGDARGGPVTQDGSYTTKFDLKTAQDEVLPSRTLSMRYNTPIPH